MKLVNVILFAVASITISPIRIINAQDDADERAPPRVRVQDALIVEAERNDGPIDREDDSSPNGDYAAPNVQPVYNAPDRPIVLSNPGPVFTGSGGYNAGPSFSTFPILNPVLVRQNNPAVLQEEPVPLPRPVPGPNYGRPTFVQQPAISVGFGGGYSNNYVRPSIGYGAPQLNFRQNVGFGSLTSVNYPRFVGNNGHHHHHHHNHQQGGYGGGGGGGYNYRNNFQYQPGFSSGFGQNFNGGFSGGNGNGGVSGGYA